MANPREKEDLGGLGGSVYIDHTRRAPRKEREMQKHWRIDVSTKFVKEIFDLDSMESKKFGQKNIQKN